jgi:hydrogenase nickel incorporation protein HypB
LTEIQVVRNVLEANDQLANDIRSEAQKYGFLLVNIMSSPGSGKTTLLEKIIPELQKRGVKVAVIAGDITTSADANRIARSDVPVVQINTDLFGGDCHLGAEVILPALHKFELKDLDLVIIENVGNLVCPAEFDTGADLNLVVISVTEGEDKPLKYPLMFRVCNCAIINKIDLLPYLKFDVHMLEENIRKINPQMDLFKCCGLTGEGLVEVVEKLCLKINQKRSP